MGIIIHNTKLIKNIGIFIEKIKIWYQITRKIKDWVDELAPFFMKTLKFHHYFLKKMNFFNQKAINISFSFILSHGLNSLS